MSQAHNVPVDESEDTRASRRAARVPRDEIMCTRHPLQVGKSRVPTLPSTPLDSSSDGFWEVTSTRIEPPWLYVCWRRDVLVDPNSPSITYVVEAPPAVELEPVRKAAPPPRPVDTTAKAVAVSTSAPHAVAVVNPAAVAPAPAAPPAPPPAAPAPLPVGVPSSSALPHYVREHGSTHGYSVTVRGGVMPVSVAPVAPGLPDAVVSLSPASPPVPLGGLASVEVRPYAGHLPPVEGAPEVAPAAPLAAVEVRPYSGPPLPPFNPPLGGSVSVEPPPNAAALAGVVTRETGGRVVASNEPPRPVAAAAAPNLAPVDPNLSPMMRATEPAAPLSSERADTMDSGAYCVCEVPLPVETDGELAPCRNCGGWVPIVAVEVVEQPAQP